MATDDSRIPTVTAEDKDLKTARVVAVVPGLGVKSSFCGPKTTDKNSTVNVKFEKRSLEISAEISDKKGKVTKYHYKANKLPGEIDTDKCKQEVKKDQVILTLTKAEEYSWEVQLSNKGLDQDPDAS